MEDFGEVASDTEGLRNTHAAAMESSPQRIELTRQELYDRVWSEPGYKVAPQLGLSDVGLAKTCKRLGVPRPPRGYWNQLAAGQKVKRLPLLPTEEGQPEKATFVVSATPDSNTETKLKQPKPAPLTVPSDLTVLNATAKALLKSVRAAKTGEDGMVSIRSKAFPHVCCTPVLAERAAAAIHVLIAEAAQRGISVETGARDAVGLAFTKGGDVLHVELEEPIDEVVNPQVDKRRPSWEWQTTIKKPAGRLCVRLFSDQNFYGRRLWTEKGEKDLEHILPQVIERMEEIFQSFVEDRALQEQREREYKARQKREAEEQKRRDHQDRLDEVRAGRVNLLRRATEWWQIYESVIGFVNECEKHWRDQQSGQLTAPQEDWLKWARQNAKAFSPLHAGYPDPEQDGKFNPDDVRFGGPYPDVRKMPDPHPRQTEHSSGGWGYHETPSSKAQFPYWLWNRGQ